IEHAKELLHNAYSQSRSDLDRLRPRKGPKKHQSDMTDNLQLVHEMGTGVHCFVPVDLAKLPVLGLESINLAAIVANIVSLKKQAAELKCSVKKVDTVENSRSPLVATVATPHIMNPPLDESPTLNDSDSETDETFPKTNDNDVVVNESKTEARSAPASQTLSSGQQQQQAADQLTSYVDAVNRDELFSVARKQKDSRRSCELSKYDGEWRLLALSVKHGYHSPLLLNVYLPYFTGSDNDDNYHEFMAVISKAIGIIGTSPTLNACIIGDFNACTTKNTPFGKDIQLMCDENCLLLSDVMLLSPDSFTFYSEARHSTSWLDHCVSTLQAHMSITDINIAYDVLFSDHFPFAMSFELPTSELSGPEPGRSTTIRANVASWECATKSDIEAYHRRCAPLLSSIPNPHVALLCSDAQCDNISHREAISKLYREITDAMLTSSAASILSKRQQRHKPVPGWNEFVKEHHAAARLSFTLWVSAGKPRQGSLYVQMSRNRARFKYALRRCKREEAQIKADKLTESFLSRDNTAFWKEVQASILFFENYSCFCLFYGCI
ncbi:hypothetical protein CAPTEDRAFT_193490, partial [Capitella teleta]